MAGERQTGGKRRFAPTANACLVVCAIVMFLVVGCVTRFPPHHSKGLPKGISKNLGVLFWYWQEFSSQYIPFPREGRPGDKVSFYGIYYGDMKSGKIELPFEIHFGLNCPDVLYDLRDGGSPRMSRSDIELDDRDNIISYYGLNADGTFGWQVLSVPSPLGPIARVVGYTHAKLPTNYPNWARSWENEARIERIDVIVPENATSGWVTFVDRKPDLTLSMHKPSLDSSILLGYFRVLPPKANP